MPAMRTSRGSGPILAGQRSPINPPTLIEYNHLRFLIADAPSNNNLNLYIQEFERYNVTDVVRVCDPTYNTEPLEAHGIKVHEWVFGDGDPPPSQIVNEWLDLVQIRFSECHDDMEVKPSIACHCVAGLGRAPVLVAIALIESGMSPLDSVSYIRARRRGAINNKQLKYIENYKRRSKSAKCVIC